MSPIVLALFGTSFTFAATALGAAMVFFFRGDLPARIHRIFLGFAAGVMIAASVWSQNKAFCQVGCQLRADLLWAVYS